MSPYEITNFASAISLMDGAEKVKVIVLEEYLKGESKDDHSRWLYTAATRAAKKLIIVRNY